MKIGTKVKDCNDEIGIVAEVFFNLVPIPRNKYHNSRRVIDAYLIKVNDRHYIYRSKDKVRRI